MWWTCDNTVVGGDRVNLDPPQQCGRYPSTKTIAIKGRFVQTFQMLINGRSVGGKSHLLSVNPFSGEEWAEIPNATEDQVDFAIDSASRAFEAWSRTSPIERSDMLLRLAQLVDEHAMELGMLETRENGKVLRETQRQVRFASKAYRYNAHLSATLAGRVIQLENPQFFDFLTYEPYGVCALLVAWNSPMQLLSNKLAAALATGNTVVIKPSENASAALCYFGQLVNLAGFPPGVVNIITGDGNTVGERLVADPRVSLISLTGGHVAGAAVMTAAAERSAKVILELGGRSAQIVFDDADVDAAVDGVVGGVFVASGQTCVAGSRLYVQKGLRDQFFEKLERRTQELKLGDPESEDIDLGPMANARHFKTVSDNIVSAGKCGIHPWIGGRIGEQGPLFIEPTIYVDLPHNYLIAREEIFGPVLAAWEFDDEQEAVSRANESELGLAAGLWTRDIGRALRVSRQLRVGTVWVNTYRTLDVAAPFGGMKSSGIGRERGLEGLMEFVQSRNTMIGL